MRNLAFRAAHRRGDRLAHLGCIEPGAARLLRGRRNGGCERSRMCRRCSFDIGKRHRSFHAGAGRAPARSMSELGRPPPCRGVSLFRRAMRARGISAVPVLRVARVSGIRAAAQPERLSVAAARPCARRPAPTIRRPEPCVPTGATISETTPSSNISTSIAPFCVSTTAITSPFFTRSPGLTSHSTKVPASMSAPSAGIRKSLTTGLAGSHETARRGGYFCRLGQCSILQMRRIGHRHFPAAHAPQRRIEFEESLLGDPHANLGGQRPALPAFVDDDAAPGL